MFLIVQVQKAKYHTLIFALSKKEGKQSQNNLLNVLNLPQKESKIYKLLKYEIYKLYVKFCLETQPNMLFSSAEIK